jgi:hypothetical protein
MKNKSSFNYNSVFKILSKGRVSLVVCGMLVASGAWAAPAYTAPVDISLKAGALNATNIATSGAATYSGTTIAQTTANAIIDWNKFNIASGEGLNFTGGNATLNRISGGASSIAGYIRGDHALFFVNPNGIVVSGTMVAPTIVLSTLDISNSDFNAGNYKFTRGSSAAAITNSGTIGDGEQVGNIGVAALFATTVNNTGTIQSNNVAIVAANAVTLGATTSHVDGSNNYDATANGYTGVSAITASSVATSITNNSNVKTIDNGGNAGNIDIYSTKGSITNTYAIESYSASNNSGAITLKASGDITNTSYIDSSTGGGNSGAITVESTSGSVLNNGRDSYIYSSSSNGNAGAVSVKAYKDVKNIFGSIYSEGDRLAGTVDVTATNGMIDNYRGSIYSYSANGSSSAVTLSAKGDINNFHGDISSYGSDASGRVSLTSTTGSLNNNMGSVRSRSRDGVSGDITINVNKDIDNSYGSIYSETNGLGADSGAVSLSATTGTIDLTKGGELYSYSDSGTRGDITISAPHLLFTSDAISGLLNQSRSYILGNNIGVVADTINGLDTRHLSTADTTIFNTNTWQLGGGTLELAGFSASPKGMVLGTPSDYPLLAQIVSGGVTITGTTAMTVAQTTANAVINWNDFSVAFGNSVAFLGGNATLNRVTSTKPSVIAGSVTSDHAIFFINPNGIIATGSMTAPTLVLSTLGISDANFNAGSYNFTGGNSSASIINYGILSDGYPMPMFNNTGVTALFASNIINSGTISAHSVALVASDTVTLGATTSHVDGSGNYDKTANGYSGVSGFGTTTVATSIINNNASILSPDYGTTGTGSIDIHSKNGDIQNHGGTIKTDGQSYGSGDITLRASGDIQNYGGTIAAMSSGTYNAGNISAISDNGNVDNSEANIISLVDASASGTALTSGNAGNINISAANGKISNNNGGIYSMSRATTTDFMGPNAGVATSGSAGSVTLLAASDISSIEGSIFSDTYASSATSNSAHAGVTGAVSVTSTAGVVNNQNGSISSQSGTTTQSSGAAGAVSVSGDAGVFNYNGDIYSQGASSDAVSVKALHGAINSYNGGISSQARANSHNSGAVELIAQGDIIVGSNGVYSNTAGLDSTAGNVSVTSTAGNISIGEWNQIYSSGNYGDAGSVSVKAYGDVINKGNIYSSGGFNGNSGSVSVISENGAVINEGRTIYSSAGMDNTSGDVTVLAKTGINNSNSGNIYSQGSTSSGNVLVKTTGGSLDLANNGTIYSKNYTNGVVGDVTVFAPEITYTTNTQAVAQNISPSYIVSEGHDGSDYTNGAINIHANTINGEAISLATLESSSNWEGNGNTYNFFGTITKAELPKIVVAAPQATQEKVVQKIQDVISAISTKTNTIQAINPVSRELGSPRDNRSAMTRNGKMFEDATAGNNAPEQNSANEGTSSPSANNSFTGQVRFMVGRDITGAGNAIAHSTMIPGIFVLN